MASNASRGAAAKARTKKFLQARGYQVADMEKVFYIFTPKGRIPTKRDQLGADLLAVPPIHHATVHEPLTEDGYGKTLFVQCKSGKSAIGGTFPDARRKFAEFSFSPAHTAQVVIEWPPRARQPRIVEM